MVTNAEGEPIDVPATTIVGFGSVTFSVCVVVESSGSSVVVDPDPSLLLTQDSVIMIIERSTAATVVYEITLRLIDQLFFFSLFSFC